MLQILGWAVLAIVVAGGLCALAVTVLPAGEQIAPALRDEPVWALPPEQSLEADDVDDVRLPVALRGYRFAETDQLLDRLAEELRARDLEIARLRGTGPAVPDQAIPDEAAPSELIPSDTIPDGAVLDAAGPGDTASGESVPDEQRAYRHGD